MFREYHPDTDFRVEGTLITEPHPLGAPRLEGSAAAGRLQVSVQAAVRTGETAGRAPTGNGPR